MHLASCFQPQASGSPPLSMGGFVTALGTLCIEEKSQSGRRRSRQKESARFEPGTICGMKTVTPSLVPEPTHSKHLAGLEHEGDARPAVVVDVQNAQGKSRRDAVLWHAL